MPDGQKEILLRIMIDTQTGTAAAAQVAPANTNGHVTDSIPTPRGQIFAGLSHRTRRVQAGDTIYRNGDTGSSVFVVERGLVRIFVPAKDGTETDVRILRKDDILSELALLHDVRYNTSVAMEDVVLREYEATNIWDTISSNSVASDLTRALLERVETLTHEKSKVASNTLDKLILALLHIAEQDGQPVAGGGVLVKNELTHEMLAGMIGARRETVTIHLQKLRAAGAAEKRGRGLFIHPEILRGMMK